MVVVCHGVVPKELLITNKRAQDFTGTVTGAGDIQTSYYGSYIDSLFPNTILDRLNISRRAGAGHSLTIPVLDSMGTSTDPLELGKFLDEGEAIVDDFGNFSNVVMMPKRFGAAIRESKQFLLVSPTGQADLQKAMNDRVQYKLQKLVLGVVSTAAKQANTATAGTITAQDIEDAVEYLATNNVDITKCVAICTPAMYNRLRSTTPLSNTINQGIISSGYQYGEGFWLNQEVFVMPSTLAPKDSILIGDWSDVLFVDWQTTTQIYDIYTLIPQGLVRLQQESYFDVKVLHSKTGTGDAKTFIQLNLGTV